MERNAMVLSDVRKNGSYAEGVSCSICKAVYVFLAFSIL